ncbi:MAG: hypothetical protein HN909_01445 [Phycisphaerales bacterium]|jgi:hypothetical protein|nr:hypothetical protein [Phycisphaerales bacterium]MBT7170412.1 hypothetical protein [Phycisphaerales bacterium]
MTNKTTPNTESPSATPPRNTQAVWLRRLLLLAILAGVFLGVHRPVLDRLKRAPGSGFVRILVDDDGQRLSIEDSLNLSLSKADMTAPRGEGWHEEFLATTLTTSRSLWSKAMLYSGLIALGTALLSAICLRLAARSKPAKETTE